MFISLVAPCASVVRSICECRPLCRRDRLAPPSRSRLQQIQYLDSLFHHTCVATANVQRQFQWQCHPQRRPGQLKCAPMTGSVLPLRPDLNVHTPPLTVASSRMIFVYNLFGSAAWTLSCCRHHNKQRCHTRSTDKNANGRKRGTYFELRCDFHFLDRSALSEALEHRFPELSPRVHHHKR